MKDNEKLYEDARELYEEELRKLIKRGELDNISLEQHYKLLDCILDTYKICEKDMELEESYEEGSSERGSYRGGRSGRYYPQNGSYYGRNRSMTGYGYGTSRNSVMDHIRTMVNNADSEHERMMYQRWLDEAERAYR